MKQDIKNKNNKNKLNPLPVEFFENLKSPKNKNTDSDDIEPFQFSKEVLDGTRLITVVGIEKKTIGDIIMKYKESELHAKKIL